MAHKHSRNFSEFVDYLKGRNFLPRTVVDVGVCYGTPELQGGFPNAYHILVEPLEEMENRLQALTKKYRGEYHTLALSSEPGTMELAVNPDAIASAALRSSPQSGSASRMVTVETLDRLLGTRDDLKEPILLKTDCQGFDLEVMKGGSIQFLKRCAMVIMEVNMFHPSGDPDLADFGEIVAWMREKGFAVYDIISYQRRPLDDALGYVDLVFVKNDGPLRKTHRWA